MIVIGLRAGIWPTITHEYCHAHQDWAAGPDRYNIGEWEQSPEGQAYLEAAAANRAAGYTLPWNKNLGPLEVAATVCSAFAYYEPRSGFTRDDLREQAPNRYRWAEEWLYRQ